VLHARNLKCTVSRKNDIVDVRYQDDVAHTGKAWGHVWRDGFRAEVEFRVKHEPAHAPALSRLIRWLKPWTYESSEARSKYHFRHDGSVTISRTTTSVRGPIKPLRFALASFITRLYDPALAIFLKDAGKSDTHVMFEADYDEPAEAVGN
jgi:hypothetical protein